MQLNDVLQKSFGVQMRITTAYHPQSNGLDERTNQTLKRLVLQLYLYMQVYSTTALLDRQWKYALIMLHYLDFRSLSKLMNDQTDDWGQYLDAAVFATNTSTTKYHKVPRRILHRQRIAVYCSCRLPDDGRQMIQCSKCNRWYLVNCTDVPKTVLNDNKAH